MNKNAIKAIVLTVALTFSSVGYVDAKRMGSGKNMGQSAPVQKAGAACASAKASAASSACGTCSW